MDSEIQSKMELKIKSKLYIKLLSIDRSDNNIYILYPECNMQENMEFRPFLGQTRKMYKFIHEYEILEINHIDDVIHAFLFARSLMNHDYPNEYMCKYLNFNYNKNNTSNKKIIYKYTYDVNYGDTNDYYLICLKDGDEEDKINN